MGWKLGPPTLESHKDFGAHLGGLYAFNSTDNTLFMSILETEITNYRCVGPVVPINLYVGKLLNSDFHSVGHISRTYFSEYIYPQFYHLLKKPIHRISGYARSTLYVLEDK